MKTTHTPPPHTMDPTGWTLNMPMPSQRQAVWEAFDKWFVSHEAGNRKQASFYLARLRRLTDRKGAHDD